MNLPNFFLSSALERRLVWTEDQQQQCTLRLRMPPRFFSKDVISPLAEAADAMAPMMDQLHLSRTHNVSTTTQLERFHSREKDRRESMARPSDITFYVGRNRAPYTLSANTLKHSNYFASLLEKQRIPDPIVLDCDEATFQNMVLILRYGSFEALPKMSESELFRLKRELECYGIDVPEAAPRKSSSPCTNSSSPYRHFSHVALPHSQQSIQKYVQQRSRTDHPILTADLPDLPEELKDVSKLVLVSRMDDVEKGIRCECTPKDQHTCWALSFHHRHTFCTGCGRCPSSLSPRFLAEMYMAAAMYYSNENISENFASKQRWTVRCDSACSLKLLNAKSCCVCSCSRTDICCSSDTSNCEVISNKSNSRPTLWAVSTYYSHAFCTRCGQAADERTLICILLTHRYGGLSKYSKPRRDHAAAVSDGVAAQESRTLGSSQGSDLSRQSRVNRSL